jgi:hypothetical protein
MNLEIIDAKLRAWSASQSAAERIWPALILAETLRRAGYHEAFPHLLMSASVTRDPESASSEQTASQFALSPAVCYHAYASLENQQLSEGRIFAARGHCFRNEAPAELQPGRRQIEFQMRELIFVGSPEWLEERLRNMREDVLHLAQTCGLIGKWQTASDPFFLPRPEARGKAAMQMLLGTKSELCLPDGLAIASINRHRTFFGERFQISLPDRTPAHSACVAFGLDRWAAASQFLDSIPHDS